MHTVKQWFVDDIFYAVKACIALHNKMVECHMENDEEGSENFYKELLVDNDNDINPAVATIDKEDELFANNANKLDINGNKIDL